MTTTIAKPTHSFFAGRCLLLCVLSLLSSFSKGQFKVKLLVDSFPPGHNGDSIYVAGSFNSWNPAATALDYVGNVFFSELQFANAGPVEFKFTRGSWEKAECSPGGEDIANRVIQITADTTLSFSVAGWKDDFKTTDKTHTLSSNVQVVDTAFEMPQLHRTRRIWIYLPAGYNKSKQHYPVLYMHDGQNLFDNFTSGYGEWGIDELLDSLIEKGAPGCIVVGIDNGGEQRMSEYNPYLFTYTGDGSSTTYQPEGDDYLSFVVQTLKPFIDKHYRTLRNSEHTIVAGSSMGGLISYYAALKYPRVFGKAGFFSPAFRTANGIGYLTDSLCKNLDGKYFFYAGGKESDSMVADMERIQKKLGENSDAMIYSLIDPAAQHNEKAWRKWFVEFYNWIVADGYNVITIDH